ncbi:MAG: hypothetical protein IPK76_22225, partial [Lewinellaceae bacterium]|nr:hypothetical protein [Lewinellaceae bacterium]
YIRKAGKSENPQDYREYLNEFGDKAEFKQEVVQALKTLEVKQVQTILQNPADAQSVRRFIVDFPDSERYMEIKTAVETRAPAPVKEVLLPEIKAASLRSLQLAPTTPKVRQVLETYPETRAEVKKP